MQTTDNYRIKIYRHITPSIYRAFLIFFLVLGSGVSATLAQGQVSEVPVQWPEVPGAAGYFIQIAEDEGFKKILVAEKTKSNQFLWTSPKFGIHFFRVAAIDSDGDRSPFSNTAKLKALPPPTKHLAPKNNSSTTDTKVTFRWQNVPAAVTYFLQISKSKSFKGTPEELKTKTPSLEKSLDPGTWYWRVMAKFRNNYDGDWSSPTKIVIEKKKVEEKKAAEVTLVSPAQDEKINSTTKKTVVEFEWKGKSAGYQLEIARDEGFKTERQKAQTRKTRYKKSLKSGEWFWRSKGNEKNARWSEPIRFEIVEKDKASIAEQPKLPLKPSFAGVGYSFKKIIHYTSSERALQRFSGNSVFGVNATTNYWYKPWGSVLVEIGVHGFKQEELDYTETAGKIIPMFGYHSEWSPGFTAYGGAGIDFKDTVEINRETIDPMSLDEPVIEVQKVLGLGPAIVAGGSWHLNSNMSMESTVGYSLRTGKKDREITESANIEATFGLKLTSKTLRTVALNYQFNFDKAKYKSEFNEGQIVQTGHGFAAQYGVAF